MPGIFPDYPAPIIRLADGDRELTTARWGMLSPVFALKGDAAILLFLPRPESEIPPSG
jgi:putative SOS response-associated peptidase YedK